MDVLFHFPSRSQNPCNRTNGKTVCVCVCVYIFFPCSRRTFIYLFIYFFYFLFYFFFLILAQQPPMGQGLLIHEVSRSHNYAPQSVGLLWTSDQLVRQIPLPDNTQHSQQTNIHAAGGTRTHNLSRRAAADQHLRPRGHWDRHIYYVKKVNQSRYRSGVLQRVPGS